ncbi:hypothetical protein Tco_1005071 [Tanacetum coccineum]|uniref:Secreted protein n=1 Tax=Tanacetum coccineum TaxID=301880 RepID=A0ABQ5FET9_9ASTR
MKVLGFVFNLLSSSFKTLVAFILSLSYEASSLSNLDPWIGVVTKGVFLIVESFLTNWKVRGVCQLGCGPRCEVCRGVCRQGGEERGIVLAPFLKVRENGKNGP